MAYDEYRTILLADSRGRYLDYVFDDISINPPPVYYYPGTTLRQITKEAKPWLYWQQVRAAYILIGVNDLTWRDRNTKRTYARHYTAEELCQDVTGKIEDLIVTLRNEYEIPHVIIIPIVGIAGNVMPLYDDKYIILLYTTSYYSNNEDHISVATVSTATSILLKGTMLVSLHGRMYK